MPGADLRREPDAAGVMMIPVPRSGILEKVEGLDEALAVTGIDEIQITARLHDFIAAWPEGSSYLGFIFARRRTPDFVEAALREAHGALRFTIAPRLPVAHPVSGQTLSLTQWLRIMDANLRLARTSGEVRKPKPSLAAAM